MTWWIAAVPATNCSETPKDGVLSKFPGRGNGERPVPTSVKTPCWADAVIWCIAESTEKGCNAPCISILICLARCKAKIHQQHWAKLLEMLIIQLGHQRDDLITSAQLLSRTSWHLSCHLSGSCLLLSPPVAILIPKDGICSGCAPTFLSAVHARPAAPPAPSQRPRTWPTTKPRALLALIPAPSPHPHALSMPVTLRLGAVLPTQLLSVSWFLKTKLSHTELCHLSPSEAAVHPENKALGTSGQRALSLQPHPEGTDSSALIKQSCGTTPGCYLAVVLGQIPAGSIKGQTPALEPAGCSMAPICSMAFGGFQKRPTPAKPTASRWRIPEEQHGSNKLSPSHGDANGLSLHEAIPAHPFNSGTTTIRVGWCSTIQVVQLKSSNVKSSLFGWVLCKEMRRKVWPSDANFQHGNQQFVGMCCSWDCCIDLLHRGCQKIMA